jgi:dihydrolipoamide dehydrogenase
MSDQGFDFDVAVIGAGSGGFAAARTAAGQGLKTALLDGASELGGLCILRGCMPTKALLYSAEVLHLARHPQTWGIQSEGVTFDWKKVLARKDAQIQDFADYRRQQLANGKFTFIHQKASFKDAHSLQLADGRTLSARHFVIATGSEVAPPPLPQLRDVGFITSDDALRLDRLPQSLILLGGGAVAVEFAQLFARFGVRVTMIQRSPHILHGVDTQAAEVIESVLRREGVVLYTGTRLTGARRVGDAKEVTFEHDNQTLCVQAEEVFFGLGRVPNLAPLGLHHAGVLVEKGRIATDAGMRTNVPHIYAAGDCTGQYEIVHIAIQQGETAVHNIAHPDQPKAMDYRLITEVIFTEPQVASVGLTEKRAQAENIPYLTASYPFNDHGKSLIMEAKDGFVKLLADPKSGEIIGGSCVGPQGGELIHEIIAAMHKHMTVRELATMPHYHPTLAEIWTYPAEELADQIAPAS